MPPVRSRIVEVIVFKRSAADVLYLALQRSTEQRLYPGLWQIISAKVGEGETAVGAALRELSEETGLPVKRCWRVPMMNAFYATDDDAVELVPMFAVETDYDAEVQLSAEHRAWDWLSFDRAKSQLVWPETHRALDIVRQYIVAGTEAGRLSEITPKMKG